MSKALIIQGSRFLAMRLLVELLLSKTGFTVEMHGDKPCDLSQFAVIIFTNFCGGTRMCIGYQPDIDELRDLEPALKQLQELQNRLASESVNELMNHVIFWPFGGEAYRELDWFAPLLEGIPLQNFIEPGPSGTEPFKQRLFKILQGVALTDSG